MAWNGIEFLKKSWRDTKKAYKEEKGKVKISKENKKLLWAWCIMFILVLIAIYSLLFHPMTEIESLSLVIMLVGVWIVIALEK